MLKIKSFTFNPYQENTYLIFDDSKEAVIIDPGNYEAYEEDRKRRLGDLSDRPHRIKYKPIAR